MKYIVSLLILFCTLVCGGYASTEEPTVHALLISDDTIASGLREEVRVDINKVRKLLNCIVEQTHMTLSLRELHGKDAVMARIKEWATSLPQSANVIFFVYFAGHGFRTNASPSPWPYLALPHKSEALDSYGLLKQLESKQPRLSILLSDCCNTFDSRFSLRREKKAVSSTELPGLKKLFLETRGSIIGSASSPGEPAYCSLRQGGFFTDIFITSMYRACRKKSPSWKEIFSITRSTCSPIQSPAFSLRTLDERIEEIRPSARIKRRKMKTR